jgi:molybdopterin-guanine dinucleotide biosynthesis protein A
MGEDKGAIEYHHRPQAQHLLELLSARCDRCFVSVNAAQASKPVYAQLPTIVDDTATGGPAAGLVSAWRAHPEVAWLVAAVDLPLLDAATLAALVRGRDSQAFATAFRRAEGPIEPLLAIWEPGSLAGLAARVEAGDASPRRCLEAVETKVLDCPNPEILLSVNLPADRDRIFGR